MSEINHASFSQYIGTKFTAPNVDGGSLELELIEASKMSGNDPNRGDRSRSNPFSLVFRGPSDRMLPQQVVALEHSECGAVELLLVPIGPDDENTGLCYEAVFN